MSSAAINATLWLRLTPTQKSVLTVLAMYADENATCSLSVPTLAKATSLCEASVSHALTVLHESGFIIRELRPCAPSRFTINIEMAAKKSARLRPRERY